jgi:hypothetical protein
MKGNKTAPGFVFACLLVLTLAGAVPASAQETIAWPVEPGEVVEVGYDSVVLDLINLRDQTTFNPVTELRQYKDEDLKKGVTKVIPVPDDSYVVIVPRTLDGKYGRYFPYSPKDGVIDRNSIVFAPAPIPTATQSAEATSVATVTQAETGTIPPTPTQTVPLSPLTVIGAVGLLGLLSLATRR